MRVRGYAAGTPCWAAVASPDPAATQAFYGALFGWTLSGDRFALDGRAVTGLRERGNGPAAWLISISTDDSATTAHAVQAAGGRVRAAPVQVAGDGTGAMFADPAGATFATWQRAGF